MFADLLTKKIKVVDGSIISEVELMRFFTTIACLKIAKKDTIFAAYEMLVNKLPQIVD